MEDRKDGMLLFLVAMMLLMALLIAQLWTRMEVLEQEEARYHGRDTRIRAFDPDT